MRETSSNEPPEWALKHAEAALRCSLKAPEIQALLIKKGLSPALAATAVPKCLEQHIHEEWRSQQRASTWKMVNRVASIVVAGSYLALAFIGAGPAGVFRIALWLLMPLACIWFSKAMGDRIGPYWIVGPYVTRPTPAVLILFGGWLVLLILPIVMIGLALYAHHGNP